MRRIIFLLLSLITTTTFAQKNSKLFTFGDLENVIATFNVGSFKYDSKESTQKTTVLNVYLCAADNPHQIPDEKTINPRKGFSYIVLCTDNLQSNILPNIGDRVYFGDIGYSSIDWIYQTEDKQFMYIILNSGIIESGLNIRLTTDQQPFGEIYYLRDDKKYNFLIQNSNLLEDFDKFKKSLKSYYSIN